jgi:CubicO group peptidase (beta-lactamase class C family)
VQEWKTSTPAEQGMDASQLTQALQDVKTQALALNSLLVIRNGFIVSETYYPPTDQDTRHELYSVTKSFTSTLIGIAIDKGFIDNIHHPVLTYFPQMAIKNEDDLKKAMTLEHLLTMSAGLDWQEGDPIYTAMVESGNWTTFVLNTPMRSHPGSEFNYCSGCSHVLSAVVQKTAGADNPAFANQNLFGPLGIQNYRWDTDSTGVPVGGWGLQLTPRDMARLGYLFLHQGRWNGQTIVSSAWVKAATQGHIKADAQLDYGYQWWINPSLGTYSARGRYGQTIYVAPRLNLIVVITAHVDDDGPIYELIENEIMPAVKTQ